MFNIAETSHQWALQEELDSTLLETTESTNTYAKDNLSSFAKFPAFVFTSEQTKGRGRGENTWSSIGNGESLLCSIVFKLQKPPQPIATPCFGWAVYRALNESLNLNFSVKAPNDIYIEDSKVGGILLESVSKGDEHHLILGLGVNVFSHPTVDNSNSLINFMESGELEENQWIQFLSTLKSLACQAAVNSNEELMSEVVIEELELALKNYKYNEIETLLNDGGFTLSDGVTSNWRDL